MENIVKKEAESSRIVKDIQDITSEYIDLSKLDEYNDNEFLDELEDYLKDKKLSTECEDDEKYFELCIYGDYDYGYTAFVDIYYK